MAKKKKALTVDEAWNLWYIAITKVRAAEDEEMKARKVWEELRIKNIQKQLQSQREVIVKWKMNPS